MVRAFRRIDAARCSFASINPTPGSTSPGASVWDLVCTSVVRLSSSTAATSLPSFRQMAERGSSSACRSARHELRLRGVPRMIPPVTLLPLTDAEYADFAEGHVAEAARQRVEAGERTPAEAPERARLEQADLLADRLRSQGHTFLKGCTADGGVVGWLWISPAPAFLERYGVRDPV